MKKIKTIALIAPSGNIKNFSEINEKINILEKKFKIKKYYSENISNGYLSDTDENRIMFFEKAFSDKEVDLVISIRGGFGAIRIVDKINYNKFKDCNKMYLGSSDATIFLAALNKNTNIKCFHGLMITNGFVENLENNIKIIENNLFKINIKPFYLKDKVQGLLWGGNLSSIVSLLSDEIYLPNKDIILFLEDINEPLYKIDKMLFEIYRNKQIKEKIKGIIFGDFYFEKEINDLLKNYSIMFNIPTFLSSDITHKPNNITIPFGINISLN